MFRNQKLKSGITKMLITYDFLIFLRLLKQTPFHTDTELIEAVIKLTRDWMSFSEAWDLGSDEILAPFNIEFEGEIQKNELPGLILVHLLLGLKIELNEVLWLQFIGELE